jgi:colicin import membrane protein
MSAVLEVDKETGEIISQSVMFKTEKAPAIIIDINDVSLYHSEPDKLVEKIRTQAGYAVFDVSTEKGRSACNSHYVSIIRCIAPGLNASKALAADAQKAIKRDLYFRKYFEESVREIAAYHRQPLTEYEAEQKRIEDEQKALEEQRISEAKYLIDWNDAINLNELFDLRKEVEFRRKQEEEAQDQAMREQEIKERVEAQRQQDEENARIALEQAEQKRIYDLAKAEREKQEAVASEQAKAKYEAEEKERIEAERLAMIEIERLEVERKAKNAPDKEKLITLARTISSIEMPEVDEEASKCTEEVSRMLSKVCTFIEGRADKL